MHKLMVSIPENLFSRMRTVIPNGDRSRLVAKFLEKEVKAREDNLYHLALQLESNEELKEEMEVWENQFRHDGLNNV